MTKPSHELLARRIFMKYVEERPIPNEPKGIIDFFYGDFIQESNGQAPHGTFVSTLLNRLANEGRIKIVRRATSVRPGRYDVRKFLAELQDPNVEIIVEKTKEIAAPVAPVAEVQTQAEVTVSDINDTIKGMISYMNQSNQEMIGHLAGMLDKLAFGDPQLAKDLQQELIKKEIEIAQLKAELNKKPEITINKHVLYRLRNAVLDDMERYINTPSFEKNHRAQYLRTDITKHLDQIMNEVGAVNA